MLLGLHRKHCPGRVFWCVVVIVTVLVHLCGLFFLVFFWVFFGFLFGFFLRWGGGLLWIFLGGKAAVFYYSWNMCGSFLAQLKVTESVSLTCLFLGLAQTLHVFLAFSTKSGTPLIRYKCLYMNYWLGSNSPPTQWRGIDTFKQQFFSIFQMNCTQKMTMSFQC